MSRRALPPELAALDVDAVLGPGGALAGAMAGYEHRPGQLAMARAVEATLRDGGFLLAEAGTGTGKTLAYLVPALLSGARVVISTATRTLQEQLVSKDIPLVRDGVGLPVSAALVKGRANYLCGLRFERFDERPAFLTPDDAAAWGPLRRWALSTPTGDRAETALPDDWPTWALLSTGSEGCLGRACPHHEGCFVTRARRAAAEAQLVVVNHALFFADLALRARAPELDLGVLPPYEAVVFDEAHALEDVATDHFGVSVSAGRLHALAGDAARVSARATLAALGLTLRTRTDELFAAVSAALGGAAPAERPVGPGTLAAARPAGAAALATLTAIAAACPEDDPDVGALHRRATDTALALERCLAADEPRAVFWAAARPPRPGAEPAVTLHGAPIDVGPSLQQHLYSQARAVIFTSATLRAGTGEAAFGYVRARLGLEDAPCEVLDVPSPFDYGRQAALYVPAYLPEPSSADWTLSFAREVYQLLRLTGGRAFVLFTSLRHMDQVHALVAPHVSVAVLKQGQAPRRALLETFQSQPSVLFASQSFWEGVDVPGEALSLVIIDRLPFRPPSEPLTAARMDAARARGQDPFSALQVPQAALALRQGFGRLIRTSRDRGIVALGDTRVLRRGYGATFLAALPPARRLTRFEEVRDWWTAT